MTFGALRMGWRHVLFANWPFEPSVVEPHVPEGLTLDTFDGEAWLSVVPFTNVDVGPPWLPVQGYRLPELNLRTYVVCDGEPGVYFFSLDAQGVASVLGARLFHHLPYYYARISLTTAGSRVHFSSRRLHPGSRPVHFEATYRPTGEAFTASENSLAAFLTERYRYYTEDQGGDVRYATVEHDPWPLYDATAEFGENSLLRANGFATPEADPIHFYSPGVETQASASRRL